MSATHESRALSVPDVMARKGGEPLACLTAYTTLVAELCDTHCDIVLVGDSVGMVLHGLDSTLGVSMEMMILHGKAVRRGVKRSLMVVDMPFGSFEEGPDQAFRNAARMMSETGCAAVKLEGGESMAETVRFLAARGIPVMGHVGLTPQAVNAFGGYRVQGRGEAGEAIRRDARAVAEAGAFAVVLEKVPESLARSITAELAVPTIGIGASPACQESGRSMIAANRSESRCACSQPCRCGSGRDANQSRSTAANCRTKGMIAISASPRRLPHSCPSRESRASSSRRKASALSRWAEASLPWRSGYL